MDDQDTIYHLCRAEDWRAGTQGGAYTGTATDKADGFIHFSGKHQVARSAANYFAGVSDLMLLTVDAAQLGEALKWETASNGEDFPHLYGDLPLTAVMEAVPLRYDENDGQHIFPFQVAEDDPEAGW